jgi:hypothetical protein
MGRGYGGVLRNLVKLKVHVSMAYFKGVILFCSFSIFSNHDNERRYMTHGQKQRSICSTYPSEVPHRIRVYAHMQCLYLELNPTNQLPRLASQVSYHSVTQARQL